MIDYKKLREQGINSVTITYIKTDFISMLKSCNSYNDVRDLCYKYGYYSDGDTDVHTCTWSERDTYVNVPVKWFRDVNITDEFTVPHVEDCSIQILRDKFSLEFLIERACENVAIDYAYMLRCMEYGYNKSMIEHFFKNRAESWMKYELEINTDETKNCISNSIFNHELQIAELVNLYKTLDFNKYSIIITTT